MKTKRSRKRPRLRFSPTAWAKLVFLRDVGPTEIGAFGISSADDPLFVENIELVEQECTSTSVSFFDDAIADYVDAKLDQGINLGRCLRIWVHTHPGECPLPSPKDEQTFSRVFGGCDWAVMAILAEEGDTYARLRFAAGPGGQMRVLVEVDYSREFSASDHAAWLQEYADRVHPCLSQIDVVHDPFALAALDKISDWYEPYRMENTNEFPF